MVILLLADGTTSALDYCKTVLRWSLLNGLLSLGHTAEYCTKC